MDMMEIKPLKQNLQIGYELYISAQLRQDVRSLHQIQSEKNAGPNKNVIVKHPSSDNNIKKQSLHHVF